MCDGAYEKNTNEFRPWLAGAVVGFLSDSRQFPGFAATPVSKMSLSTEF